MPGMLGCIGVPEDVSTELELDFARRWDRCESRSFDGGVLVGHSFTSSNALHEAGDGLLIGLDGEWSLYQAGVRHLPHEHHRVFRIDAGALHPTTESVGNVAVIDPTDGVAYAATDWTGTFPLYFAPFGGGIVFCTLLRPIARITSRRVDEVALLEFLREGQTLMGKSLFADVNRLMPGQSLTFRVGTGLQVHELSRAWTEPDEDSNDPVDSVGSALVDAVERALPADEAKALMMSAGWDSRTLLAAALKAPHAGSLSCYSHGDPLGRELRLVQGICESTGVRSHLEAIDDDVLHVPSIQRGFDRVETAVFPHWHRAGRILRERETVVVTGGVHGEILGGHYGPPAVQGGTARVLSLLALLLDARQTLTREQVRDHLRLQSLGRHWYLDRDFEESISDRLDRLNHERARAIDRLEARGVRDPARLVEAFLAEHRGTQYVSAQLLSCRSSLDVAVPFGQHQLFRLSTRLPLQLKVHNRFNQQFLRRHSPTLLRFPLAATVVSAGAPILLQEISRAVRRVYEATGWKAHYASGGRLPHPRLGWLNFEFLRGGRSLRRMVDDLQAGFWDVDALYRAVSAIETGDATVRPHPIFDQLCKIYTVDLMLRSWGTPTVT